MGVAFLYPSPPSPTSLSDGLGTVNGLEAAPSAIGGFFMVLGSRLGAGCTSGHGLSGMAILRAHSFVAVPVMFLAGILVAFAWDAVCSCFCDAAVGSW